MGKHPKTPENTVFLRYHKKNKKIILHMGQIKWVEWVGMLKNVDISTKNTYPFYFKKGRNIFDKWLK